MPSSNALSADGAEAAGRDAADIVLVQAVGHPAEQLALVEHRADQHHVLLMRGADPGIVGEEHVAVADAGIVAAVLEDPLHLRVGDARHVLHVGPEIDELGILGEDRGVEVERVHRHGRARDALDGGAVLLVHVPQIVADDLERDRIEIVGRVAMELELGRDREALRRHIRVLHAIECDPGDVVELGHGGVILVDGSDIANPHIHRHCERSEAISRKIASSAYRPPRNDGAGKRHPAPFDYASLRSG